MDRFNGRVERRGQSVSRAAAIGSPGFKCPVRLVKNLVEAARSCEKQESRMVWESRIRESFKLLLFVFCFGGDAGRSTGPKSDATKALAEFQC